MESDFKVKKPGQPADTFEEVVRGVEEFRQKCLHDTERVIQKKEKREQGTS